MSAGIGIEKPILVVASIFVLALTGVIALSVRVSGIGLPTCVTDVEPFREAKVIQQAPKRYEIHYVARMWKFEPPDIAIAPGSTADIYLSTADVTHGMQIIGTNVNLMAVPGAVNYARVKFDKPGDYLVVCNEYCGVAHHNMAGRIHVSEQAVAAAAAAAAVQASAGHQLLDQYGCTACHSIDGSEGTGPTLKGLYGRSRVLANGRSVTADDRYIRESIVKPEAKIVKGYENLMPSMEIPPQDLDKIIDYIKALK